MTIGLEDWFMNFTQIVRSGVTPESLANVPRPYTEFAIFGFLKGGEVASFLGGCIVHPIYRFILKRRLTTGAVTNNSYKIIRTTCRKLQGRFLIGGLVLGPLTSIIYASRYGTEEMKETCYKIRCNDKNMALDRTSFCLGFLGWYWKRFQGAVDGVNIALAYSFLRFVVMRKEGTSNMTSVKPYERLPHAADNLGRMSILQSFFSKSDNSPEDTNGNRG